MLKEAGWTKEMAKEFLKASKEVTKKNGFQKKKKPIK